MTIEETTEMLKNFKENKVPGNGGLPSEFLEQTFWHLLGENLINSFNAAVESGSASQRQAIVTPVDKKEKDHSILDN